MAQTLDRSMPAPEVMTLEELLAASMRIRRPRVVPAVGLAGVALAMTVIGLLGTLSRFALERRREWAIRAALGASPRHIARNLVATGGSVTAAGLVAGLGLSLLMGRGLRHLLYGVGTNDAATFALVTALVGSGAMAACYVPARRAARLDPAAELRHE